MKTRNFVMIVLFFGMAASATAQDVEESKYGTDSVACVTNISLYREYYKQWEAAKFSAETFSPEMEVAWREVFMNCPRASELTYTNGLKIIDYHIRNAKTVELRNAYIDTLCMIYDARATYFPTKRDGQSQVASILGRKGFDIYSYNPKRFEEAYAVLKEATNTDINQLQAAYLDTYFRAVTDMANNNKIEKMEVITVYQQLSDAIDNDITTFTEAGDTNQIENCKGVKNNIDNMFQPFASCEDLVKVFSAKMAENPNDVDILRRITVILEKRECTDSKLFLDASMKLYELDPSPESAYNIGVKLFNDKKWSQAAVYFEQAGTSNDAQNNYKAFKNVAYCYLNANNFSRAREAARRAIAIRPSEGEPYLIIGNCYAASAKEIGGIFDGRDAYWAAVDKFIKAKQVDPSVTAKANELINVYSQYYPSMETIFFNDLKEGGSYTVGGWIQEATTIRASK